MGLKEKDIYGESQRLFNASLAGELSTREEALRTINEMSDTLSLVISDTEDQILKLMELSEGISEVKINTLNNIRAWSKTTNRDLNETINTVNQLNQSLNHGNIEKLREFVELAERFSKLKDCEVISRVLVK